MSATVPDPTPSVPSPVLDYGLPPARRSVKLLVGYGVGALLFGGGCGMAVGSVIATMSPRARDGFGLIGGAGVAFLLWGLFTLVLVAYLRFVPRSPDR